MAVEEAIEVETLRETPQTSSQPAFQPDPVKLDEKTVRAAMMNAAQNGVDPFDMTVGDLANPPQPVQAGKPVDVPEKFKKPNGEVDVEKLKASTERLDEAIQAKEQKVQEVQRSIDDYVREYKAKETKLSGMPNPARIAAQLPPVSPAPVPAAMTDQQLEAMINADIQQNPARTVAQLVQIQVEKTLADRLRPIEEDRRDNSLRDNIRLIAEKDPRILNQPVFDAVNLKLQQNPEMWNLKNPHKAAWLEVKEEMRLGDLAPNGAGQAQPRTASAPILGGGTPPPAPSLSDTRTSFQTLDAAISQMSFDPRKGKVDVNQQKALDQAAKEFFDSQERLRPR